MPKKDWRKDLNRKYDENYMYYGNTLYKIIMNNPNSISNNQHIVGKFAPQSNPFTMEKNGEIATGNIARNSDIGLVNADEQQKSKKSSNLRERLAETRTKYESVVGDFKRERQQWRSDRFELERLRSVVQDRRQRSNFSLFSVNSSRRNNNSMFRVSVRGSQTRNTSTRNSSTNRESTSLRSRSIASSCDEDGENDIIVDNEEQDPNQNISTSVEILDKELDEVFFQQQEHHEEFVALQEKYKQLLEKQSHQETQLAQIEQENLALKTEIKDMKISTAKIPLNEEEEVFVAADLGDPSLRKTFQEDMAKVERDIQGFKNVSAATTMTTATTEPATAAIVPLEEEDLLLREGLEEDMVILEKGLESFNSRDDIKSTTVASAKAAASPPPRDDTQQVATEQQQQQQKQHQEASYLLLLQQMEDVEKQHKAAIQKVEATWQEKLEIEKRNFETVQSELMESQQSCSDLEQQIKQEMELRDRQIGELQTKLAAATSTTETSTETTSKNDEVVSTSTSTPTPEAASVSSPSSSSSSSPMALRSAPRTTTTDDKGKDSSLVEEKKALTSQIDSLVKQLKKSNDEAGDAKKIIIDMKQRENGMETEIKTISDELLTVQKELDAALASNVLLEERTKQLDSSLRELKDTEATKQAMQDTSNARITELETANESMKESLDNAITSIREYEERESTLQAEKVSIEQLNSELRERISSMELQAEEERLSHNDELQRQLGAETAKLSIAQRELDDLRTELQTSTSLDSITSEEKTKELDSTVQELKLMRDRNDELQSQIANVESSRQAIVDENNLLQARTKELDSTLDSTLEELKVTRESNDELQSQIANVESSRQAIVDENNLLQARTKELDSTLDSTLEELKVTRESNDELQSQIANVESSKQEVVEENKLLQARTKELDSTLDSTLEELKATRELQSQIANVESSKQEIVEENKLLQARTKELDSTLDSTLEELKVTRERNDELQSQIVNAEASIQEAVGENNLLQARTKELDSTLDSTLEELKVTRERNDELQSQIANVESSKQETFNENNLLKARMEELESSREELTVMRERNDKLQHQIMNAESSKQAMIDENNSLMARIKELDNEMEDLKMMRERNDELQHQIMNAEISKQAISDENTSMMEKMKELNSTLEELTIVRERNDELQHQIMKVESSKQAIVDENESLLEFKTAALSLQDRLKTLEEEKQSALESLDNAKKSVAEFEESESARNAEKMMVKEAFEQLKVELRERVQSLERQLEQEGSKHDAELQKQLVTQNELDSVRAELEKASTELDRTLEDLNMMRERNDKLQSQVHALVEKENTLNMHIGELQKETVSVVELHERASLPKAEKQMVQETLEQQNVERGEKALSGSRHTEKKTQVSTLPEPNQKKKVEALKRKKMIGEELDQILKQTEEEELDPEYPFEAEAVDALKQAAVIVAYRKVYYDALKDEVIYFPSVAKCIINYSLMEEAEKYYFEEDDEFPMEYTVALRTVADIRIGEGDNDNDNEEYMAALAMDVELFGEDESETHVIVAASELLGEGGVTPNEHVATIEVEDDTEEGKPVTSISPSPSEEPDFHHESALVRESQTIPPANGLRNDEAGRNDRPAIIEAGPDETIDRAFRLQDDSERVNVMSNIERKELDAQLETPRLKAAELDRIHVLLHNTLNELRKSKECNNDLQAQLIDTQKESNAQLEKTSLTSAELDCARETLDSTLRELKTTKQTNDDLHAQVQDLTASRRAVINEKDSLLEYKATALSLQDKLEMLEKEKSILEQASSQDAELHRQLDEESAKLLIVQRDLDAARSKLETTVLASTSREEEAKKLDSTLEELKMMRKRNDELQLKLTGLEASQQSMSGEISSLTEYKLKLQMEQETLRESIKSMQNEIDATTSENKILEEKARSLDATVNELATAKQRLDGLQSELETMEASKVDILKEKDGAIKKLKLDLEKDQEFSADQMNKLQEVNKDLVDQLTTLQNTCNKQTSHIGKLQSDLEATTTEREQQLDAAREELKTTCLALNASEEQAKNLDSALNDLKLAKLHNDELKLQLKDTERKVNILEEEQKSSMETASALKDEIKSLQAALENARSVDQDRRTKINSLQIDLQTSQSDQKATLTINEELTARVHALEKEAQDAEATRANDEHEVQRLSELVQELEKEANTFETIRERDEHEVQRLSELVQELENEAKKFGEMQQRGEDELRALKKHVEDKEKEMADKTKEAEEKELAAEEIRVELDRCRRDLKASQDENERVLSEQSMLKEACAALVQENSTVKEQSESLRNDLGGALSASEEQTQKVSRLVDQLQAATSKIEEQEAETFLLQQQIKEYEARCETHQNQLSALQEDSRKTRASMQVNSIDQSLKMEDLRQTLSRANTDNERMSVSMEEKDRQIESLQSQIDVMKCDDKDIREAHTKQLNLLKAKEKEATELEQRCNKLEEEVTNINAKYKDASKKSAKQIDDLRKALRSRGKDAEKPSGSGSSRKRQEKINKLESKIQKAKADGEDNKAVMEEELAKHKNSLVVELERSQEEVSNLKAELERVVEANREDTAAAIQELEALGDVALKECERLGSTVKELQTRNKNQANTIEVLQKQTREIMSQNDSVESMLREQLAMERAKNESLRKYAGSTIGVGDDSPAKSAHSRSSAPFGLLALQIPDGKNNSKSDDISSVGDRSSFSLRSSWSMMSSSLLEDKAMMDEDLNAKFRSTQKGSRRRKSRGGKRRSTMGL